MPRRLTAAARTPWVRRGGQLANTHPEKLLRVAITEALRSAALAPSDLAMMIVACDSPVGAQAANIARRVAIQMGATEVPAITIDGDRISAYVGLVHAEAMLGPVVVAAVDMPSVVPPGAALVRDYGRPTPIVSTDSDWLAEVANRAELTRLDLDTAAAAVGASRVADASEAIAAVSGGGRSVVAIDVGPETVDASALEPLVISSATLTAAHLATLADGAAAVIVDDSIDPDAGRPIIATALRATTPDMTLELLRELVEEADPAMSTLLCDTSLVVPLALGYGDDRRVSSVVQLGSAPSADALRMLVDAFHCHAEGFRLLTRGRSGQVGVVEIGPNHGAERKFPRGDARQPE